MIGKVWRGICQAVLLGACGVLAGLGLRAAEAAPSLDFAGYAIQPAAVPGEAERFGGISGLDFDREAGRFVAITDARNAAGQGAPRYYTFRIEAGGEGGYRLAGIESHPLRPPGDAAFPAGAVSAEAIRLAPDGGFYWASEGECGTSQPTLWRNAPGMAAAAPLPIRTDYHYPEKCVRQPEPGLTGARDNGALESLALSPDGATLYYAAEYPLLQDMDAAAAGEHAVRITATPADGGSAAVRQFAYILPEPFGVTEMLTLGTGRFLVLEREYFGRKKATVSHLALATLGDATDLAAPGTAVLKAGAFVPMQRQELLVLNGSMTANAAANLFGSGAPMDNLEAMAWGCAAGTPVLAVAADDNFNAFGSQQNLFLLFRVTGGVNACEAD